MFSGAMNMHRTADGMLEAVFSNLPTSKLYKEVQWNLGWSHQAWKH
jgi:hypothetical protein